MPHTAHWRFALFYFCYYAALGAYTPYVGRWIDALGHGGYVVGSMLGLWYGSRILGPPLWSALIERTRRPGHWLVAGCTAAALCFAAFVLTREAFSLFAVMIVFGVLFNAVMPQFESMTLTALGANTQDYGRLRLWGSIGFLIVAGSYGALLDALGSTAFPWVTLPLLVATAVAAWPHRNDRPPEHQPDLADADHLWKRPGVRRFLLIAMLMQAGFGPFYVFFTLHLQDQGHDGFTVGLLWAVAVLVEIALFWQAPKLITRFGAARLLSWCLAVTVARWLVTAFFADSLAIMLVAQASHALSFAMFHACCMRLMTEYFPGRRQAAGQSLLYSFSSGGGGVLGAGLAALAWVQGRGEFAFAVGAALTGLAWLIYATRRREATVSATV